ncbi:hypothetical protein IGI04_016051 [Brassica rapa subsp. trilocularis]|uniref:Maturase K n=1 Tax=Brassica rapa subsp. trilocularis TaxID=1813537 RepID=A0ABQ7MVA1_BRACM|nr:hypothetical protein IGI04_016051 [Brassica rapa subsp. trilocularis]
MKYRGNHIFSEYTDEISRKSYFLGISINLYCSSEFPRNIPRKFRGTHVWASEYSEEIPRKNKCSLEFARHSPRLFRRFRALLLGFLFLRKSRVFKPKTTFCGLNNTYITPIKCLRLIMNGRRNFLGIFSFNRANKPLNISRKLKLKILREFRRKISKYSEEVYPSEYSDDIFLGIFRGLSDELVVLRISSKIHFLGIPSEISEGFPRKNEFSRSYFR